MMQELYLFDRMENLIGIVPAEELYAHEQEAELNKLVRIFVSKRYDTKTEEAFYIGHKDIDDESVFHTYRTTDIRVENGIMNIEGIHTFFDEMKAVGYLEDRRPNNQTAMNALAIILEDTRWQIGGVYTSKISSGSFYYQSKLSAFWEFIDAWGIEFGLRMAFTNGVITGRYVDIYDRISGDNGKWFERGDKLIKTVMDEQRSEIYTALVGRGRGEEKFDETGTATGGFGRKINFKDVEWSISNGDPLNKPLGQAFIELPTATAMYGFPDGTPRIGIVEFDRIEEPELLLQATYEELLVASRPRVELEAEALETGLMELGEVVAIIDDETNIRYKTRVFKLRRNFLNKKDKTFTFGDKLTESLASRIKKIDSTNARREETIIQYIQTAANGKNKIFRSEIEPTEGMMVNDLWYKPIGNGETEMYQWDGMIWELILSTLDINKVKQEVEEAVTKAEEAKQTAENAYNDAVAEAERLVDEQTVIFDAEMDIHKGEILEAKEQADLAISKTNDNTEAIFGKLDAATYEANKIEVETELGKKLETATYNAQKQTQDALIAGKVATETYNAKVTELNSLIDEAQSKADTAVEDLLKKADTTFVNTELAKKVAQTAYDTKVAELNTAIGKKLDTSVANANKVAQDAEIAKKVAQTTYNTKMNALDTAISGHTTRIEATETGLLAKASTTDVNALKTRMSTAETSLTTNANAIALKASQEDLDTVEDRLETTEAELVVQAGEIASKVAKTDFNSLSGRMVTAESTIIQHASEIASRVKQTDFDSLSGRVGTAESSITQQAGEIASKVATTTYNAGIATKENAITKANTAPSHGNGKLWLNTSVTPNVLNRSNGTTWIKVTPTTANEVGAFSSSDGSALKTRVSTAESSITQQAGQISLKASQSDLNVLDGRMDSAESELSVQSGQIASKVSQSEFNAVEGRLGTAESSITQQASQIASKVSQTDFNALNGRVGTAESTISQQAGEIALRATTATVNALTGRVSDAESSLSVQSGKIDLAATKSELTNAIDDIQVGGRNYFSYTYHSNRDNYEFSSSYSHSKEPIQLQPNTEYTFSYEELIRFDSGQYVLFLIDSSDNRIMSIFNVTGKTTGSEYFGVDRKQSFTTNDDGLYRFSYYAKGKSYSNAPEGEWFTDIFLGFQIEKGNKATDWTPAPEDVDAAISTVQANLTVEAGKIASKVSQTDFNALNGRVGTAESTITQQAGQIALKASQTTVDTLAGKVSTAETNISANTTAINLRATKSSVDTLTGRVTTAEGSITTQAGQIALRATTATVNALTGRVSTAESTISANTTAINLRATKTELTTAIDGIQVGGRNYLIDSQYLAVTGGFANHTVKVGDNGYVEITSTSSGGYISNLGFNKSIDLFNSNVEVGETYTVSFAVRSLDGSSSTIDYYDANAFVYKRMEGEMSDKFSRFHITGVKVNSTFSVHMRFNDVGKFEIKEAKLEKGNKATDWTPAPEDVDASIATVQSNLTVEAGKITALTTRVSGAESNIASVTQTVSGINTTISTLRTDVNGKATIVSLNEVKSTADGNKTTISNHAGRLTTVETTVSGLQTTVSNKADKSQITQLTTSISTKVESATYNSKMTQLDNAINLRVVQGDVTAAILADKKIKDTRTTNKLPSWYFTNYPSQRVEEFKTRTVVGVPGASSFVKLVTDVPWTGTSGGVVVQTAYSSDGIYTRSGNTAATAWGSWVKQTDSSSVLAQINLSTEGVLIQGKRIQLDGDVTMTTAYTNKLNAQTLTAITANITSIRSQVLVTDSVTSTHIKAENALIDGIFGTTALITRLTSKTAFINNIKAITISADKVTTGTLNAANVSIINMNAANITTGRLNGLELYGGYINGGRITSTGTVGELAINSASLTVYNDKVVNGKIQRAVVALSNEAQDFPGLRIWHGVVNSAGTVVSSFGSTNITPEDGISTGKPLKVGSVTITGGSNIQNSVSTIMHITDAQDRAIDLGVKNLIASGNVSGAKVVAGHLTLDGGNNIVSNSNNTINFMRTDGQRTNIAANTIESTGMRIGTSSTLYLLNSDMMYIANTNDELRDLRVRNLSARDRVTGGNLSLFNNDIVHNGNADIHFTGANGARMNIHAARVSSGNQVMSTGNTYYALNGNTLYFADRNDARIDIGVRTVSQSSEYRLKAGFEIIGEQEAIDEILKTDVVKYHFKGDDEPRLGLIIGGGYQTSGLFVAKDGRSKKDSDIIGALMLSVKYLYNAQNTSTEHIRSVFGSEIWQLKNSVNSDITRINTFVSQHDIEIDNLQKENEELRQRIELLEEKTE